MADPLTPKRDGVRWSQTIANHGPGDPVAAVRSYADIPPQARAELAEAVGATPT